MRRILNLDDYSPPPLYIPVTLASSGGKQSLGSMTDEYKMKDIRIDTIIRNSDKESKEIIVNERMIMK